MHAHATANGAVLDWAHREEDEELAAAFENFKANWQQNQ